MKSDVVDRFGIPLSEDDAFERATATRKLDGLQLPIARHLVLLFSLPESDDYEGWLNELRAWRQELSAVLRGKKGTVNLKYDVLKKAIWTEPFEEPGDRAQRIKEIAANKKILLPQLEDRLPEFKALVEKYISSIISDTEFNP